jgi:hypothetical protein
VIKGDNNKPKPNSISPKNGKTNEDQDKEKREKEVKERVAELSTLTDSLITRVRELLGNKRLFGYAFVYDGMDYIKVVTQEMRQLKSIIEVHTKNGGEGPAGRRRPASSQCTSAAMRSAIHSRV